MANAICEGKVLFDSGDLWIWSLFRTDCGVVINADGLVSFHHERCVVSIASGVDLANIFGDDVFVKDEEYSVIREQKDDVSLVKVFVKIKRKMTLVAVFCKLAGVSKNLSF
jgi:hypothetical protein